MDPTTQPPAPLFRALGYHIPPSGIARYYIEIAGYPHMFTASEMYGLRFLSTVNRDTSHWYRLFPSGGGRRKIDSLAALDWFLEECHAAGKYTPPPELTPRAAGRPYGSKKKARQE